VRATHRPPRRVLALLLAAFFLGGVGGASDIDALLFHSHGVEAPRMGPHYEPAGAPNHHADHCLLTLRLHSGNRPAPFHAAGRAEEIPDRLSVPRPAAAPERFDPALHQESRAPPAVLA
jgi:hypothetical protein